MIFLPLKWNRILFLFIFAFAIVGCASMPATIQQPQGNPVNVATIPSYKQLSAINESVADSLYVSAYPNEVMCFSADDDNLGNVLFVCLDKSLLPRLREALQKSLEWGETAKKNQVEIQKPVIETPISVQAGMGAFRSIMLNFGSFSKGDIWSLKMQISYYNAFAATSGPVGSYNGDSVSHILSEGSVKKLLDIVDNQDVYFSKARKNDQKAALFK